MNWLLSFVVAAVIGFLILIAPLKMGGPGRQELSILDHPPLEKLFESQEPSSDPNPDGEAISRYERTISKFVIGEFEPEDAEMASLENPPTEEDLRNFLNEGEEKVYQIGIAFVGNGHAEVVIRDGDLNGTNPPKNLDLTTNPPTIAPDEFVIHRVTSDNERLEPNGGCLRVFHLRNVKDSDRVEVKPQGPGDPGLVLALEQPQSLKFNRYADLYRIRTTERRLKHFALISCPKKHVLLISDCSKVAQNFLTKLLDDLHHRYPEHIDEQKLRVQKDLLTRENHVSDGSYGVSERESRQHPVLGKTTQALIGAVSNS
jgi:hypothetical protein